MIRNKITEQLNSLLPAYINGSLNRFQRKIVEIWLQRDEQARTTAENLKTLQSAVQQQPRRTPSAAVFDRIQAQIQQQQTAPAVLTPPILNSRPALGYPVLLLSIVTLILAATVIWQTLPPGIVLQWSVQGLAPEAFRVYRAEVNSGIIADESQFELLDELPATNQADQYTFTDFRLLPGQNYIYRVEGLNAAGQPAASQTISGRAIDALPGQLAILLVLFFTGYCFWNLLHLRRPFTTAPA
jgi:hypothetical protein